MLGIAKIPHPAAQQMHGPCSTAPAETMCLQGGTTHWYELYSDSIRSVTIVNPNIQFSAMLAPAWMSLKRILVLVNGGQFSNLAVPADIVCALVPGWTVLPRWQKKLGCNAAANCSPLRREQSLSCSACAAAAGRGHLGHTGRCKSRFSWFRQFFQ
jgi:hypothetical protein